jgi:hypothetical protein
MERAKPFIFNSGQPNGNTNGDKRLFVDGNKW